ncbi:MAG: shikimate kinase [Pseudomonadota bacterium]
MAASGRNDKSGDDDGGPGGDAVPPRAARSVVLVGMMGVGKTTIGRRLAPRLGLPFFDADEEIVAAAGMSIADLFERHGEAAFRRGEAQVIRRLLDAEPCVLATGGGAFMNADTRAVVRERALSVWLKAGVDTLVERATRRPTRPLLKIGDPRETIARLLAEREPVYATADLAIDTGAGNRGATIDAIVAAVDAPSSGRNAEGGRAVETAAP